MKKQLVSILAIACAACGESGDKAASAPAAVAPVSAPVEYSGDVSGDLTWETGKTYTLKGLVTYASGKLTVQPGAIVKGENGSALVIMKDATIEAIGTAEQPIVFTSASATPAAGDWGGVILLGKAPLNLPGGTGTFEDFPYQFVDKLAYGDAEAAHKCGRLGFVRIEYSGFALVPGGGMNGLTLGGCGSETTVENLQVHRGADDGVEVFGGAATLRNIVITQPGDDGLDWDFGWTGNVQNLIVQMAPDRGDKGIEGDNNLVAGSTPVSAPEIWNFTLVGPNAAGVQGGIELRSGTAGKLENGIVLGFPAFALNVGDKTTAEQHVAGALSVRNVYFAKGKAAGSNWPAGFEGEDGDGDNFNEATVFKANNKVDADPKLTDAHNLTAPNFAPVADSAVLKDCGTPTQGFDMGATHCGAIGATDWTKGWTVYP